MEEEIAKLKQERDELAALAEVMRDVLIESNNRIQQRQFVGDLVGHLENAISITGPDALREIQASTLEEAADGLVGNTCWCDMKLRDMAAAIRKGE